MACSYHIVSWYIEYFISTIIEYSIRHNCSIPNWLNICGSCRGKQKILNQSKIILYLFKIKNLYQWVAAEIPNSTAYICHICASDRLIYFSPRASGQMGEGEGRGQTATSLDHLLPLSQYAVNVLSFYKHAMLLKHRTHWWRKSKTAKYFKSTFLHLHIQYTQILSN